MAEGLTVVTVYFARHLSLWIKPKVVYQWLLYMVRGFWHLNMKLYLFIYIFLQATIARNQKDAAHTRAERNILEAVKVRVVFCTVSCLHTSLQCTSSSCFGPFRLEGHQRVVHVCQLTNLMARIVHSAVFEWHWRNVRNSNIFVSQSWIRVKVLFLFSFQC